MKKNSTRTLILAMIMLIVFVSGALAEPTALQKKTLKTMVNAANKTIKLYVRAAQATPWDDVAVMQKSIESTVKPVMHYADKIGATVICEYEDYFIDGRWVSVDPLRVVND